MNYLSITKDDTNNGDGVRVVLWVSGCSHHCKGCQNAYSWDPKEGHKLTDEVVREIANELEKDYIDGITYSGGDPLHENNRKHIAAFCITTRKVFPNKTQWLYTGYTHEELLEMNDPFINTILSNIDVLVDGKYVKELNSPDKPWVGSSNQNVIYLKNDK